MTGWRTEQLYGEGYINAAEVMAHEIFELQNTDILDTLSETIFMNTSFGEKLLYLSQVLSCEVEDEEIEEMLDNAYDDESIGITYCKEILSEIKKLLVKILNMYYGFVIVLKILKMNMMMKKIL